jgi:glycosyltransferase involved in cell wall biosynthesis
MMDESKYLDPIEFSVIIPLYNKESSIGSTIDSVLNQTYSNFELIIVNDGSTDKSLTEVQKFDDSRIKIYNKLNGGVSSARNFGIEKSQKQFIVFLDADDFWFPFCLAEYCKLIIEFPDAEVYCTNYNMTGKNLKGSDRSYIVEDYYYTSAFYLAKWSIPIMLTGCVSIRRNLLNEVGYFDLNITHGEDIDMWERLAKRYRIAKSEKVTTIYRTETENRASLIDEKFKKKADQIEYTKPIKLSKSQKLYVGVQLVFELKSYILSGKNFPAIRNLIGYFCWIVRGILFIIKVRILKFQYNWIYSKSK